MVSLYFYKNMCSNRIFMPIAISTAPPITVAFAPILHPIFSPPARPVYEANAVKMNVITVAKHILRAEMLTSARLTPTATASMLVAMESVTRVL